MNFPVFDLHCDTACALLGEDRNSAGALRKNQLHIDLERAKALAGYSVKSTTISVSFLLPTHLMIFWPIWKKGKCPRF